MNEYQLRTAQPGDSEALKDLHRRLSLVHEDSREVLAVHPEIWKVQLAAAPGSPLVVNYICNVHGAAMTGTFSIVPNAATASTQGQLDTAAAAQYAADVAAGQAVESSVAGAAVTTNPDVSHLISMTAGAETSDGHVQILEMLPGRVNIKPGDSVKWITPSQNDPHTVTFPQGPASPPADPFSAGVRGRRRGRFCISRPPTFGCAGAPGSPPARRPEHSACPQCGGTTTSPAAEDVLCADCALPCQGKPWNRSDCAA